MTWIDKTKHVKPRREFDCDACGRRFEWREETEPVACPLCGVSADMDWVPPLPSIRTNAHRAGEFVAKVAEEDFGLTNMNDHLRAGDVSYKPPSQPTTQEAEQVIREIAEINRSAQAAVTAPLDPALAKQAASFWAPTGAMPVGDQLRIAAPGAAEARAMGADPIDVLQKAPPPKLNVVGWSKK